MRTLPETTQLPITRVSLYKNGVGFFEHADRVIGNQTVSIDDYFTYTLAQPITIRKNQSALVPRLQRFEASH